jgi:hypothetical protein
MKLGALATAAGLTLVAATLTTAPSFSVEATTSDPPSTVVIDNTESELTPAESWRTSTSLPGYFGDNYAFAQPGEADPVARWRPGTLAPGTYAIDVWLPNGNHERSADVGYRVHHAGQVTTFSLNQQVEGGYWAPGAAELAFAGDGNEFVELVVNDAAPSGAGQTFVIADAVRFVEPGDPPTAPTKVTGSSVVHGIQLTWDEVDNASHYIIERSRHPQRGFEEIATGGATGILDPVPDDSRPFYYTVIAANAAGVSPPSEPIRVRWTKPSAPPELRWNGVFLSSERIAGLREHIATNSDDPALTNLFEQADRALGRDPKAPRQWYVPPFYSGDPANHRRPKHALMEDANEAYSAALTYRLTDDERYAEAAATLINAWATEVEALSRADDSALVFSYHFPALIFAADLLEPYHGWDRTSRREFAQFVRDRAVPMNTMRSANNWANWGTVLVISAGAYLRDRDLFAVGLARWKELIDSQVATDGTLPHEITRNNGTGNAGIWYTHFSLQPQTIAAEVALVNGVDVFDYTSPTGMSLHDAFHVVAGWVDEPTTFPIWQGDPDDMVNVRFVDYELDGERWRESSFSYFEILTRRWPNPSADAVLVDEGPVSTMHSAPHMSLTHGR